MPPGESDAFRFVHRVRVRFRDLDPMGHAHHTFPLICFEEARAAYWREVVGRSGLDGIDYVIAEARARYLARIGFPAELVVGARVVRLGVRSFTMDYEIRGEGDMLLAEGTTIQVMYDYSAGGSKPIPADVRDRIDAFERGGD